MIGGRERRPALRGLLGLRLEAQGRPGIVTIRGGALSQMYLPVGRGRRGAGQLVRSKGVFVTVNQESLTKRGLVIKRP